MSAHLRHHVVIPLSGEAMNTERARWCIKHLAPHAWGFKLHPTKIIRFQSEGYAVIKEIKKTGRKVFVDLKGFDIPSEVADMVRDLESVGVDVITLHAAGGAKMLREATSVAKRAEIYAITILTSMKGSEANTIFGKARDAKIIEFAKVAVQSGCRGTVSSASDLALFENITDLQYGIYGNMKRIIPGIRFADAPVQNDDQDRTMAPGEAFKAGATLEVMGRPILGAADPVSALKRANTEIWDIEGTYA